MEHSTYALAERVKEIQKKIEDDMSGKIDEMGLTQDESEVMNRLMDAYRVFHRLGKKHPDELRDFVDGIHRCQDVLAVRICRRIYPKGWPTFNERGEKR